MNSTIGNRSIFERVFHLSERGTTLRTELIAGATTFLSCVSIMVLNPTILAAAGMDQKAVFWATALSSCIVASGSACGETSRLLWGQHGPK